MINRWEILLEKGQAYLELQNYEKAINALQKALAEKPDHVPILKYLAECNLQSGKKQEAIRILEKIVKLSPTDYDTTKQLGDLFLEEGKTDRGDLSSFFRSIFSKNLLTIKCLCGSFYDARQKASR